ncbi:MAG: methylated-DNA--[protein]-cysteine S-methyltransferase, partial [Victivallales bacterium]|nr:methylated-DNA--[protein]-cysteine S-methyltransferase [Victivallales bacterium]
YLQHNNIVLEITGDENGINSISFVECKEHNKIPECLAAAHKQLEEYFSGKRKSFCLNLNICGTDFQKKVWTELLNIPYGETRTYQDIAFAIGNPKASRAVGGANNKNKIPIIIPCHRVIGKGGSLVGFGGGLERKKQLLKLER